MTTALADACMFHATLFAASAYLDLLRGESSNIITLYHQTETLRLLTSQLSASNMEVTDALIAVTMTLAQTEVFDRRFKLRSSRWKSLLIYHIGSFW